MTPLKLMILLNDKRRRVYDAFFNLPSSTLGMRCENGDFELGFFSQSLVPFGLMLAILRNDFEKSMEGEMSTYFTI